MLLQLTVELDEFRFDDLMDFFDFCNVDISVNSDDIDREFCLDNVVLRILECSVTSGSPPKPVVCKERRKSFILSILND